MVPHLVTALNGPLLDLERKILDATPAIERWFRLEWQEHTPAFYCSVDLRNAGFKLAPVDTNLFPGAFNNLPNEVLPLAVQAAMASIEKICPDAKNLLIIPERETRNAFYLENVARLATIMRQAGLNVRFGTLDESIAGPVTISLADGQKIVLEPLERTPRRLGLKNFDPCSILLNNDLSAGVPPVLENLHEQYVLPPIHAGWAVRRKSTHFSCYDDVAKKFAKIVDIDPWMVNPYFAHVEGVDFEARAGDEALAGAIDAVMKKIARKYREYGISEKPYVVIKSDAGTDGRGVMTVHDASEVTSLTKGERARMSTTKSGLQVHDVIVQEGVYTFERIGDEVAEPVVYMIDRYVVGGFYRVHGSRERDQNLHAPGMHYVPLGFEHTALPDAHAKPGAAPPNRFYMYGVVARLGLLAASVELEKTDPEAIQV
ncbi:glutamate--cysteine ligase [Trinickia sp. EG282A]|uniref:glutamate--cysteine ligase n=1 Tax=Trinickia sp. EG282A TaxID=3237013 RepID=UPI0034D18554